MRPNWDGGNLHPDSPIHAKGLLHVDGSKKPAWFDAQRLYRAVDQHGQVIEVLVARRAMGGCH